MEAMELHTQIEAGMVVRFDRNLKDRLVPFSPILVEKCQEKWKLVRTSQVAGLFELSEEDLEFGESSPLPIDGRMD